MHIRILNSKYTRLIDSKDAMAEINHAMMEGKDDVAEMNHSRASATIRYNDGRSVVLRPATPEEIANGSGLASPEQGPTLRNGEKTRIITAKGRRYIVSAVTPARPRTPGATTWVPHSYVSYWSEKDGQPFGASRIANEISKPGTISRAIWDAVSA